MSHGVPSIASRRTRFIPLLIQVVIFTAYFASSVVAVPYKHLTYAQVHFRLKELVTKYSDLITLTSAQKLFSLPHVGNCTELSSSTDTVGTPTPCTIWIVQLTNHSSLTSSSTRPEVFVSGEVHGDEVLGPLASLAFIEYLLKNYGRDEYATRMIDTRIITITPMTNAIGFHRRERFETQTQKPRAPVGIKSSKGSQNTLPHARLPVLRLDPNRDFPYDQPTSRCLRTVAARTLNELFLRHVFRLVVTFHGGTNALAYEWGDSTHCNNSQICPPAPDTKFMHALAERMSEFAGTAGKYEAAYPIGDMGRLVYPVHGGMEDWAYGAGWTSGGNLICRPSTLGGYPSEVKRNRRGDPATKRAVTYLVEMSLEKQPNEATLGDSDAILTPGAAGDGHVPRNVRLLMALADAAEPYVALQTSNEAAVIRWRVGGSFSVDGTLVQWSTIGGMNSGEGKRQTGIGGVPQGGTNGTVFKHVVDKENLRKWGKEGIYYRVVAVVDQALARQVEGAVPDVPPQSHVMGGRASENWQFEAGGHHVVGRYVFYSKTVLVQQVGSKLVQRIVSGNVEWGSVGEGKLHARRDMDMFHELLKADGGGILLTATSATGRKENSTALVTVLVAGGAGLLGFAMLLAVVRWFARRRSKLRDAADLASAFSLEEEDEERIVLRSEHREVTSV